MKEQHFTKYLRLVKDNAIRDLYIKAQDLPQTFPPRKSKKRGVFQKYAYSQTQNTKEEDEQYATLLEEAKEEITGKLKDFLMEEDIERLKMEQFLLDQEIAIERNQIQSLKMKVEKKERVNKINLEGAQREEKVFKRVKVSPRKQRQPYSSRSVRQRSTLQTMKIYPAQNIHFEPQKHEGTAKKKQQQVEKEIEKEADKTVIIERFPEAEQEKIEKKRLNQSELRKIELIERQLLKCENQLRRQSDIKYSKKKKKQCKAAMNSIWNQILLLA